MMNEQEMQFADPDWQPTGQLLAQQNDAVASPPQPVSVMGTGQQVPGGYQSASQSSYSEGYRGSWQEPQPSMPPSPAQPFAQQVPYHPVGATRGRGASRWWIWLIIAIVLIMMMSGGMFHSAQRGNGYAHPSFPYQQGPVQQQPQPFKQGYDLQGATQVSISDSSGNVTVVQFAASGEQSVTVATDDGSVPQVGYQNKTQTMTISSQDSGNITVYVPLNVSLNLDAGENAIEVDNFSGQLTAQTDSAQITLNNDNLSQGSSLNTNSGGIDLEQGTVSDTTITSSTGTVVLDQVNLSGKVAVSTGGEGTITYAGSLDPQGNYQFTTDSGSIDLTLPSDTAMQTQVTQKSGNYHSDFPNVTGSSPQASVGVTTNSGDITISQQ